MSRLPGSILLTLFLLGKVHCFLVPPHRRCQFDFRFSQQTLNDEGDEDTNVTAEAVIKVDDGGSDLTDRFKYKVNALMGVFDPQGEDNERQQGNILNVMISFPVTYTFNAVGKTFGDETIVEQFTQQVKDVVSNTTGDVDGIRCLITPLGKNFTKISIQANVESAAIIANTYDELEKLEMAVMSF